MTGLIERFKRGAKAFLSSGNDSDYYGPSYNAPRRTKSGLSVNEEIGLKYSAVWAATRVLSETLASLPLSLMERMSNGSRATAEQHHLHYLVHSSPNREMDSFMWRDAAMHFHVNWGNAFSEKEFNGRYDIVGLWPIHSGRIPESELKRRGDYTLTPVEVALGESPLEYHVSRSLYGFGEKDVVPSEHMFHLTGIGAANGIWGRSVIRAAAETIGLGKTMEELASAFFANAAVPRVVVKHPHSLSDKAYKRLRDDFTGGSADWHKTQLLEEGMEIEKLTIEPEAAQFLQSREFSVLECARWYRVPPHLLAHLDRAIQSNIEQEAINFVQHSMLPWVRRWEFALNRQLLKPHERNRFYFKFNLNGLLRADSVSRAEYYSKLSQASAFSPEMILQMEDMDTFPGANRHFVPAGVIPLDRVDDYIDGMTANPTENQENGTPSQQDRGVELTEAMQHMVESSEPKGSVSVVADLQPALREQAMPLFIKAFRRIHTKHMNSARRACKKPDKFLDWANTFTGKNEDSLHGELDGLRDIYPNCDALLEDYCIGSVNTLVEASGVTADKLEDSVITNFSEWFETKLEQLCQDAKDQT